MSHVSLPNRIAHRSHASSIATRLAIAGGAIGVLVGVIEVSIGPSIRSWVGGKYDTTGLGIATIALSTMALACAIALVSQHAATPSQQVLLAFGILVPGVVCFTTVGRLWFVPGTMLCTAGVMIVADLRRSFRTIVAAARAHWPDALCFVLGLYMVALGAAAGNLTGLIGVIGGLAVMALSLNRRRVPPALLIIALMVAASPFAIVTWWSIITPVIAAQIIVIAAVLGHQNRDPA